jgi:ABC-type nitrate/sulfonate/bicarbonate transport system substrate-binding protein
MKKVALLLFVLMLLPAGGAAQSPAPDTVRLALYPSIYNEIALFLAIDEGFFTAQHLNVQPIVHTGSSQVIIPELVRGAIDVAPLSASPSLFNQVAEGFDSKLVASQNTAHKGWNPAVWIVVRQDEYNKTIRLPHDLRGKHLGTSTPGSEGWYLTNQLLIDAALKPEDVNLSTRYTTPADWLAGLRNVNDAEVVYEPTVTQFEQMGLAHRWISIADVDPAFQESYLAASGAFIKAHPDALRRFLVAYLQADKMIYDAHGRWTPELIRVTAKWTGLTPEVVRAIPTPPYTGDFGTIMLPALARVQRYWHTVDLVKTEVQMSQIADPSFVQAAQRAVVPKSAK